MVRAERIVRPGQDESDTHVSETELADYPTDCEVVNGASLEHLWGLADELADELAVRGMDPGTPLELVRGQLAAYALAYDKATGRTGQWGEQ